MRENLEALMDGNQDSPAPGRAGHLVHFYDDETAWSDSVSAFTWDGLDSGQAAILITTDDHFRDIRNRLRARGADVDLLLEEHRLIRLDASEMLASFFRAGALDAARFEEVAGAALDRAAGPGARAVRVYGEVVDFLCRDGRADEALALERMWTRLGHRRPFRLLCGYSMRNLSRTDERIFARICAEHTDVSFLEPVAPAHARLQHISHSARRAKEAEGFRLLVESVKDYAIFMLDPSGVVVTWNAGAERIKGYQASEIIGSHFSRFYPEPEIAAGKCEFELAAAAREGRFEDEGYRLRKDGAAFWANVVITALRDEEGALVGFAKVTRDLTERKKAEEARLLLVQAQESNRIKDQFLATVSHELRTPLSAILGWATLLATRTADPAVTKGLEVIRRNAQAQAHIIEDVLDVARIASGKLSLEMAEVDLAGVVRATVDGARPNAESKRIRLELIGASQPVPVHGDSTRLQQVIWNLLSNALKFTPTGGSVVIELAPSGLEVVLSVRDTGIGIEPSFLPQVFERFSQGDGSTTRRAGGLGLGLAIVRHLVEMHGGGVTAESPGLGRGTTFSISLPLSTAAGARPEAASALPSRPFVGDPLRPLEGVEVLVVEDDPDARELLGTVLEGRGARVRLSSTAAEAQAILDANVPHVIVSDIGLPDEDGYELARNVRSRAEALGGGVPIIAVTAYASAHDKKRAILAGCDHHLAKPVDSDELVMLVEQLARERHPAA